MPSIFDIPQFNHLKIFGGRTSQAGLQHAVFSRVFLISAT
jgi:hypothetical protein